MFGSVELKFQVVAHHRLICDAGRWDETAMKAAFTRFESVESKMVGTN